MKNRTFRNLILIIATVSLVGIGATAFAGKGKGGWDRGPGSGRGYMMEDLTDEQVKALEQERNAFRKDTESLRQNLRVKKLELRTELARENPDTKTALALQKEISNLKSDLDQKRIEHILKMQKIHPNAGRGYMKDRGGRGGSRAGGGCGGYGPRGGGSGYRGDCGGACGQY